MTQTVQTTIQVTLTLSRAARDTHFLATGEVLPEHHALKIPLPQITGESREILQRRGIVSPSLYGMEEAFFGHLPCATTARAWESVPARTVESLPTVGWQWDNLIATIEEEWQAYDAQVAAAIEAAIDAAAVAPVAEWLRTGRRWVAAADRELDLYYADAPGVAPSTVEADTRLSARFHEAAAEADRRNTEIRLRAMEAEAARQEAARQEAARQEAQEAARLAVVAEYVRQHGTPSQRSRLSLRPDQGPLGVLPEEEALAVVRDGLFAPLADMARYERITRADLAEECESGAVDESPNFSVEDAATMTAEEFDILEAVQAALQGVAWDGHEVIAIATVRRHEGVSDCGHQLHEAHVVTRTSVRVELVIDGIITLSREYAAE